MSHHHATPAAAQHRTVIDHAPALVTVIAHESGSIAVAVLGVPGLAGPPGPQGAPGDANMQWATADW